MGSAALLPAMKLTGDEGECLMPEFNRFEEIAPQVSFGEIAPPIGVASTSTDALEKGKGKRHFLIIIYT